MKILKEKLTKDGLITLELNNNNEFILCLFWESSNDFDILENFGSDEKKAIKAFYKSTIS